jgi:predicted nucleotidyltransferase
LQSYVEKCVKAKHYCILERAVQLSDKRISQVQKIINEFLQNNNLAAEGMCFALIGSVGRKEALEASDIDVIPIALTKEHFDAYQPFDADLRTKIQDTVKVKVSKGEDLTKATWLHELLDPESIGGTKDDSAALTKRVLLLTESVHAGGDHPIADIRSKLLEAYAQEDRTSGRHVLSLCNDIARYYKTLCIEYKSKIDEKDSVKDWCTRNVKLRHSRKIWYFSNIMTVCTLADMHPQGDDAFKTALLEEFDKSPVERLATAIGEKQPLALGRLLESYAMFLEFMSTDENRTALAGVKHDARYSMTLDNPFPAMKFNSDLIHSEIMSIIEEAGFNLRSRIMGWFML